MIALNKLSMAYGQKLLFLDVDLNLNDKTRYALVGANGSGKSTFFKLVNGEEEPSAGQIIIPKDATFGWLKQDQFRYENTLIRDLVLQGNHVLWQALQERAELLTANTWDDNKGYRLAELEEIIAHHNGYTAISDAENILIGLGIATIYFEQPLKALSGGYKLRVLLAKLLFQRPTILLLDEPTNHLDIISINWLEKFLKKDYQNLVIFISHDQEFIDNLADYILDIDYGEIRQYSGNYKHFLAEKQLLAEQKLIEKKSMETKIAHMQKFVDRFRAKASKAAQAKSRMKMIGKIELPDIKNSSRIAPLFYFSPQRVSGKLVLKTEKLTKAYNNKQLFKDLNFEVQRGEKIAIMGANGIGKSTLIKTLVGIIPADHGISSWGQEVQVSYFSQDHHALLNKHLTVLQWLTDAVPTSTDQQIRKILGQMLFVQKDVEKDILSLSGGEAARLLLAKIILENANLLILDEPTNHLDLETVDALADALTSFSGTVIFVSHNRHFVLKIAKRILYFAQNHKVIDFKSNYTDFVAKQPILFGANYDFC